MMKKINITILLLLMIITMSACSKKNDLPIDTTEPTINEILRKKNNENDIYYSLFVRSFADSDNDGIGDLNGVTENLDYLEELGVTALWLLPIFQSPSYHGYDTLDYLEINPEYGTMDDFKNLIIKAKEKDIKIVIDLVINHTSDKHPWYLDAVSNEDSEYRDYFVWTSNNTAYQSFVGGMVDLNLENPAVVNEIYDIVDYYLDIGVHGFRMDAAQHLFDNHGLNQSLANNITFLSLLKHHIEKRMGQTYIVNEVFVNNDNILADYYNTTTSNFNFYIQKEIHDKIGIGTNTRLFTNNLERHYNKYREIYDDFIDAPFIGNHDMDRVASMGAYSDVRRLHQATNILLTLPGSPYIYYGDELAMRGYRYEGDIIEGQVVYDEYRRQPFLWGNDKITTTWLPSDGSNNNTKTLEEQRIDSNSTFNVYKTMINIRKSNPALMYGNTFHKYEDGKLQGYVRYYEDENIKQAVLVIHNLTDVLVNSNISDLKVLFGSREMAAYGTTIFEIPYDQLKGYIK